MIVCLRTVAVLPSERQRYLAWIAKGRTVRQAHGILAELVLEPASGEGDTVVVNLSGLAAQPDAYPTKEDRR